MTEKAMTQETVSISDGPLQIDAVLLVKHAKKYHLA